MTVQKIKSGRINTIVANDYVGDMGIIFYNQEIGDLAVNGAINGN